MRFAGERNCTPLFLLVLLAMAAVIAIRPASAYSPQNGDNFRYSETIKVDNGQGSYTGYTEQTFITGGEDVKSVNGSTVLTHYAYAFNFSNNQGNSSSGSKSGDYTWSTSTYTYVNGTDNQVGYSNPVYVWFAMNPSVSVGDSFWVLNTNFTVQSLDYSLQLPTEGKAYFQTIEAMGTGQYQRNDVYGVFTATYTWYAYFDPATGYIVGYDYKEQDSGSYQGQPGSFSYTDTLYVTTTSYPLAAGSAPSPTDSALSFLTAYLWILLPLIVVLLLVPLVFLALRGRRRRRPLPEHSPPPPTTPSSAPPVPWASGVDLGSRPPEQVVIRDVAKVNCRYCGTLIPTTADHCPYCGAPRE